MDNSKELRNLLLDCRTALRRSNKNFAEDPLRERIDIAVRKVEQAEVEESRMEPETFSAQQVALAWQIAARNLRLTHPELHERMVERVHEMLDVDVLHDPTTEILNLQSKLETNEVAFQSDSAELAALRQKLASAVSLVGRDAIGTESECTQRRLNILLKAAASPGAALPTPVAEDDPNDLAHTREELMAVAQGQRPLSRWERAWCVAEALVMTEMSAAELQNQGDAVLAKLVMAGPSAPSG